MPTTLPSLGKLQSGKGPTQPTPTQPTPSDQGDQGIAYLDQKYGVSPDRRFFYVRDERNGGWRQLDPNNPEDQKLIKKARQILGQVPRATLQQALSNALQKTQRAEDKANFSTARADNLAAKFGVPKPDANQKGTNNRSNLPETNPPETGAYPDDLSNYQNLDQSSTNLDSSNLPDNLPDQSTQNSQLGLGSDADFETQAKPPYQPKPDDGSQLPPLGSLRDDAYPKDYSDNLVDDTNDGFSKNGKPREEPDEDGFSKNKGTQEELDGDRYRPQWREEEDGSRRESEDDVGQYGGLSDTSNRQPTRDVSGSTSGSGNQRPDQSLGSRIADYKDKFSKFTKNFGNAGQQGPLTNKLGQAAQAANKASQALQKAQQAAAKAKQAAQAAKQAAQAAKQAAQVAKQAAQVAKLGARVGAQLIRLLLPLLVPVLKFLLIILIVIIILFIIVGLIYYIVRLISSTPPPPTESLSLGEEVPVPSFIGYILSDGFNFGDEKTNPIIITNTGDRKPRFSLLPREDKKVKAVLQLIRDDENLRNRINRLLYEGVRIKINDNSPVSGLEIKDSSADNRIILRIAWMWTENGLNLGPDWYFHNCNDRSGQGPAGISPRKFDLSDYCGVYGSGQHQIAGFQLGDRRKDIKTAYEFCFNKEFPFGAGQIMQENLNYSSDATRAAWNYNNPVYDGIIPLGDLNTTDFYPSCSSRECEARTQLLVKHPCMAMYLNTAADTWADFNNNWGNSQVILSALHYYILDLKAGAS